MTSSDRYYVVRIFGTNTPEFLDQHGRWVATPGAGACFTINSARALARDHMSGHHAGPAHVVDQSIVEALVVLGGRIENAEVIA